MQDLKLNIQEKNILIVSLENLMKDLNKVSIVDYLENKLKISDTINKNRYWYFKSKKLLSKIKNVSRTR